MKLVIVLLVAFAGCIAADAGNTMWNFTSLDRLKKNMFLNYDQLARPDEQVTNVNLGLTIIHLDVDESRSVLSVNSWIRLNWTDSKLKWDPANYGNLTVIRVGDNEVWKPDITVYNSANGDNINFYGDTHALAYNIGSVLWVPPTKFDTFCKLNLKYWPFDVQTCSIVFGSWTHSGYELNLRLYDPMPLDLSEYVNNGVWTVVKSSSEWKSKVYPCCEEPYFSLTFNVTIQRNAPMIKAVVCSPALLIVILTLLSFWMPPQSSEKIIINGVSAVITSLMLLYFSQTIPVQATATPLIVTFYSIMLELICLSTIFSVISINLSRNVKSKAVPRFIKNNIIDGFIGKMFGPCRSKISELNDELKESSTDGYIQRDWIVFAVIIDRIMFVVFLVTVFVLGYKLLH